MSKKGTAAIVSAMGIFMSIMTSLVELVEELGGTMEDIHHLATQRGRATLKEVARVVTKYKPLRLVLNDITFEIPAVDGTRVISSANNVFSMIDSSLEKMGADEQGLATERAYACVYYREEDMHFAEMFSLLSSDISELCFTQAQIVRFLQIYKDWLKGNAYFVYFLFESHGEFFVARVSVGTDLKDNFGVYVYQLGYSQTWDQDRSFVVVPSKVA